MQALDEPTPANSEPWYVGMRAERMNLFMEGHEAQVVLDANIDWQVRILKRILRLGACWSSQNEQAYRHNDLHQLHQGSALGRVAEQCQMYSVPATRVNTLRHLTCR